MKFTAFTTCGYCIIVPVSDLLYFQSKQGLTHVYLVNGEMHRINSSLKLIEAQLNSLYFFRCHLSYLVALNHVIRIDRMETYTLILRENTAIPVAMRQRSNLKARLKQLFPGP